MGRSVTLHLPDEMYEAIRARAMALGATPEQYALKHLTASLEASGEPPSGVADHAAADTLESLIGTITCEAADVAARHDEYIGRAGSRDDPR